MLTVPEAADSSESAYHGDDLDDVVAEELGLIKPPCKI